MEETGITVDVKDISESEYLSIFPNPTQGTIQINYRIKSAGLINIYLTDVLGNQTLLKRESKFPSDYVGSFDLKVYPQGIYNIVFQTGDRIYSERILIMK